MSYTQAMVAFEEGNFALAAETLDRQFATGKLRGRMGTHAHVHIARANIANHQGLPEIAIDHARRAKALIDDHTGTPRYSLALLREARALAMATDTAQADVSLQEALSLLSQSASMRAPENMPQALRVQAEVRSRAGDLAGARAALREAVAALRAQPPDDIKQLAHALDVYGAVLTASGEARIAMAQHEEEMTLLASRFPSDHPLVLRASLQLARARQIAGLPVATDLSIPRLAEQLSKHLPEASKHRRMLVALTQGLLKDDQPLLIF
jgi:tetratricopeptide (TPR) repeat protein